MAQTKNKITFLDFVTLIILRELQTLSEVIFLNVIQIDSNYIILSLQINRKQYPQKPIVKLTEKETMSQLTKGKPSSTQPAPQEQQPSPSNDQPASKNIILSGSNVSSVPESNAHSSTVYFDIKNKHPIKPVIYVLFNFLSFVCNFNYSVQNAVITMMMISFMTPNIVDSLIWIIPNIIAILIRPYLIRYVHKAHKSHRMRSEAFLINFFIILTTIGAFMISQSGLMNHSKKGFHAFRIIVCSIGWTLTGMSFQLIEYFADKFKQTLQEQCFVKSFVAENEKLKDPQFTIINFEEKEANTTFWGNYKFLGSVLGYLTVLLLFALPLKNTKKMSVIFAVNTIQSFFQQSSVAYTINGFLALLCTISFYIIVSYSGIPKKDPQVKVRSVPFKLSYSPNYYLPGLSELRSMPPRGVIFLAVHFMVIFVMDVMFIYTTMWTAGSTQTADMKSSEANFFGMNNGVFYLILFTFVYYGDFVPAFDAKKPVAFQMTLVVSSILFLVCFWVGMSVLFLPLIVTLALFLKTYENSVEPLLQSIEPQIKVSKELIVRVQKIAVLNVMPFISMILLDRDDIQDCMLWCALLLPLIALLLAFGTKGELQSIQQSPQQNQQQQQKAKKE